MPCFCPAVQNREDEMIPIVEFPAKHWFQVISIQQWCQYMWCRINTAGGCSIICVYHKSKQSWVVNVSHKILKWLWEELKTKAATIKGTPSGGIWQRCMQLCYVTCFVAIEAFPWFHNYSLTTPLSSPYSLGFRYFFPDFDWQIYWRTVKKWAQT